MWNGIKTVANKVVDAVKTTAVKAATAAKTFYTKNYDTIQKMTKVVAGIAVVAATVAVVATAAALVGLAAAVGGVIGGMVSENKGESFTSGWVGGAVSGAIQATATIINPAITVYSGGIRSGVGTAVTEGLSNALDRTPEQQVSVKEIIASATVSAITGAAASTVTAGFSAMLKEGGNLGASVISTRTGDKLVPISFSAGQSKFIETVFSASDDYLAYILSDILMSIGEFKYAKVS